MRLIVTSANSNVVFAASVRHRAVKSQRTRLLRKELDIINNKVL